MLLHIACPEFVLLKSIWSFDFCRGLVHFDQETFLSRWVNQLYPVENHWVSHTHLCAENMCWTCPTV